MTGEIRRRSFLLLQLPLLARRSPIPTSDERTLSISAA